jgi:hypothetical protein
MDLATKKKADSWHGFISGKGAKKKTGYMTGACSGSRKLLFFGRTQQNNVFFLEAELCRTRLLNLAQGALAFM